MKDSYDWIREELVIMKSSESAILESLEEACMLMCDIVEEVYDYHSIQDILTGMLYLKKLIYRVIRWKSRLENTTFKSRSQRNYDDWAPDAQGESRDADMTKEVFYLQPRYTLVLRLNDVV